MKDFKEPFIVITNNENGYVKNYSVKNILKPIFSDKKQASPGDFPNNIEEIYCWVFDDYKYEAYWWLFCKLNNGNYAYFKADVCSCGFTDWGQIMELYVSRSYKKLLNQAFDKYEYEDFMQKFKK